MACFTPWGSPVIRVVMAVLLVVSSSSSWIHTNGGGIVAFSLSSSPTTQRRSAHLFGADLRRTCTRRITKKRQGILVSSARGKDGTSFTQLHSSSVMMISTTVAALDTFWRTQPYLAAGLTCGIKASAADMVAQKRQFKLRREQQQQQDKDDDKDEEEKSIRAENSRTSQNQTTDYQRNLAFLLYGAIYQGVAQEFVYNHLYPAWFGTGTSMKVVAIKVLFDLLVQTTLVTLPIAYLTKAIIYQYSFSEAMRRYVDDIKNHGLLKKYVLLWGPVQCLTFSIVPEHLRVTFIAFVSFFWLIILSTIASRTTTTATTTILIDNQDECSLEDGLTCNIDG
jgi:Mpv17 / PMP22 family